MILSLCLLVYLHKLNLLLMARGTLSFRKLREEVICGHNITLSERESFSELKTNVLTVMLCLNWVNKESGDKQTWLRGYMNEVTICLSPCLSAHLSVSFTTAEMQQCGVTGLGPSAANHTTHPLHYSNSISIRPPNKSPVRASRCDMLLASDLKPRCRRWDIQLLYHGCKTLYGCTHTQTHTHTQTTTQSS